MKLYELVIAVHPWLSTEESNDLIAKVEALFPSGIKEKDEIGYQTVYNVRGLNVWAKVYFISYLLSVDSSVLPEAKQKLKLMKGLVRTLFMSVSKKDHFKTFSDINTKYTETLVELASKDKKAKKTKDQKQQLLDTAAKDVEVEVIEEESNDQE